MKIHHGLLIISLSVLTTGACDRDDGEVGVPSTEPPTSPPPSEWVSYSTKVENIDRTYHVYFPPSIRSKATEKRFPVVFAFNGGGGTGEGFDSAFPLKQFADKYGFLAVFPEGIDKNFNDGRPEVNPEVDDIAFVDKMLDELPTRYYVIPTKNFATGISNGGLFTYRLACERANAFVAIAPVAANMGEVLSTNCNPSRPVSVLNIEGDDDPLMPYQGGEIRGFLGEGRGQVLSSNETVTYWTNINQCRGNHTTTNKNDVADDGTSIRTETYSNCRNSSFVRKTVVDGGHTWPGGSQYLRERLIGKTSREFGAGDAILQFFKSKL